MSNLVRVKDPTTGTETTVGRQFAKNAGLTVIDKPATDDFGRALPAKRNPLHRQAETLTANSRREDLETAARDAGVPDDQISGASNRQALVDLIAASKEV